jgi:hypothetical protein
MKPKAINYSQEDISSLNQGFNYPLRKILNT